MFRTHGCRNGPSEPNTDQCHPAQNSCGFNEIWSYGNDTQPMLEKFVRLRSSVLKPYIRELDANVTARGVPTMRPLAYEFPSDPGCRHIDDQYVKKKRVSTILCRLSSPIPSLFSLVGTCSVLSTWSPLSPPRMPLHGRCTSPLALIGRP